MDYRDFKDLDFAADDYFIRWVRFPDVHSNHFWEEWLNDHPHKAEEVNRAKRLLLSINMKPAEWEEERQVLLKKRIMLNVTGRETKQVIPFYQMVGFKVAATITFCMLMTAMIANKKFSDSLSYVTNNEETKEVLLPDGSIVKMNTNTTLLYKKAWWSSKRNATLEGEAFFKVKHDDASIFTVHYGKLHAKVLGTSFNIKSYKGLDEARVTVVTGKVEVGDNNKSFGLITPNKEVVYKKDINVNIIRTVDARKVAGWNKSEVNLVDVPFSELIFTLQNVYNVKINYPAGTLKDEITTIHFKKSDDLQEILKVISMIHHLKYTLNNQGKVVIDKM